MTTTCPITVYPTTLNISGYRYPSRRCGAPLAPGARFCAAHERDRVRLGGAA